MSMTHKDSYQEWVLDEFVNLREQSRKMHGSQEYLRHDPKTKDLDETFWDAYILVSGAIGKSLSKEQLGIIARRLEEVQQSFREAGYV